MALVAGAPDSTLGLSNGMKIEHHNLNYLGF